MNRFFTELRNEIWGVSTTLFKIMIPTLLVVKALEMMGLLDYLAIASGPLMSLVGLPESMGIVWVTTLFTNIYTGMLVFFYAQQAEPLTVAQVTIISLLMLIAHALPIEARIARQAGIRIRFTLLLRLGGGLILAAILNQLYLAFDYLQQPSELIWQPELPDTSLWAWVKSQAESLLMIQLIIIALLTSLKVMKVLGIERLMKWLLSPVLKLLGIGHQASSLTIIGVTLGINFGGGLLIYESRAGHISKKDVFAAMSFLALCHSIIEDTLLVMVLGADLSGVLWARLIFSIGVIALLTRFVNRLSDETWNKHLTNQYLNKAQTSNNAEEQAAQAV
ncbi:hypothetical protein [Litoribrevibacter albus]|uniref:Nucleoside recognition protein n=1 Tax=Litoribrevibacter albus TaxID=1473156 RepID=A0AA37SCZ8_9GAMM|nr:hypothetical protein [Litoribrevibacter albus]GLQ32132.1 nucleoside recognition protein [Litoribrevibacter albus]